MKTQNQLIIRERALRLASATVLLLALLYVLLFVDNVLVSFVLSFTSAYFLAPFVRLLRREGISKNLSIILPFLALLTILSIAVIVTLPILVDQAQELQNNLPRYMDSLSLVFEKWESKLNRSLPIQINLDLSERVGRWAELTISTGIQYAPRVASHLVTVLLLSPLFTFFILKDGQRISRQLLSVFPNNLYELVLLLGDRINRQMGDFVRARLIEALIVGILVWIGLFLLGFPYAIFLALFAVLMNLIPYIGPIIGFVPAFLIALINQDPSFNLVLVSMVYLVAQVVDMIFIIPLIVARTVNLHPLTVIIVFIIGSNVMGILGMIISVPIASAIKLITFTIYDQLIKFKA